MYPFSLYFPPIESFCGDWKRYEETLFKIFINDFMHSDKPKFPDVDYVDIIVSPSTNGKAWSFCHIISEGDIEAERTPNLRRCERIRYPKAMIENCKAQNIKVWMKNVQTSRGREDRIHISNEDCSYLVVLTAIKQRSGFTVRYLVTGFFVEEAYKRKNYQSDFKRYRFVLP